MWSVRPKIAFHEFVPGGRLDNEDHAEPFVFQVLAARHRVAVFGYDPRYFKTEAKHLSDAGLTVVEVTPSSGVMADAIQGFWEALLEGKVRHDGCPVFPLMSRTPALGGCRAATAKRSSCSRSAPRCRRTL